MSLLQLIKFSAVPLTIGTVVAPLVLSNSFWENNKKTNAVFSTEKLKRNCYVILKDSSGRYILLYCSDDLRWVNPHYRLYNKNDQSNKKIKSLTNEGGSGLLKIGLEDSGEQEINFQNGSPK